MKKNKESDLHPQHNLSRQTSGTSSHDKATEKKKRKKYMNDNNINNNASLKESGISQNKKGKFNKKKDTNEDIISKKFQPHKISIPSYYTDSDSDFSDSSSNSETEDESENRTEDEEYDEDDEDDEDDDGNMSDIIQVDFDFFDLLQNDKNTCTKLISDLIAPISAHQSKEKIMEMVNSMIGIIFESVEKGVNDNQDDTCDWPGSTVKPVDEKEADPLSFMTVIPLNQNSSQGSYILSLLKNEKEHSVLLKKSVGWIFKCQTMINMPSPLSGPLFSFLMEEIKEFRRKSPSVWSFEYFVMICRTYKFTESEVDKEIPTGGTSTDTAQGHRRKTASAANKSHKKASTPQIFYLAPEDELFEKYAEKILDLSVSEPKSVPDSKRVFYDEGIIEGRRLFIIGIKSLESCIDEIRNTFKE